jgi:DNA polymerase III alpha subunit (gram-positive type)
MLDYKNPIIFDLETTSIDPQSCEIIQIAALAPLSNDKFEVKVKFKESFADPKALEQNSWSRKVWHNEAVPPNKAREQFTEFIRKHATQERISKRGNIFHVAVGMGYNIVRFDSIILQRWYKDESLFLPMDFRMLDVLQLALWEEPGLESYKLGDIAKELDCLREDSHDAMVDVEMTADVAAILLNQDREWLNLKWVKRRLRQIDRRNMGPVNK